MSGRNLRPGDVLVVVHDFDARSGDELTLRRAEKVQLIELDDGFEDGWYLGKHLGKGTTGLFPGVYTSKFPASATNKYASRPPAATTSAPAQANSPPRLPHPSQGSPGRPHEGRSVSVYNGSDSPRVDVTRSSLPISPHTAYVQRTIGEALRGTAGGSDSPVMNETLNVIEEHITDLATPRQSLAPARQRDDSASEYSTHLDRQSYLDIAADTDDDSLSGPDEATVKSWDHLQTAQHLRDIGVDAKHCDIFEEQEITGDVLLDMDQNFVYMKEFDFGVMGRRLKTWHKIRDFQREVRSRPTPGKRASAREHKSDRLSGALSHQDSGTSLIHSSAINETDDERDDVIHPLQPTQQSKRTSWAGRQPYPDSDNELPTRANTSMSHRSRRHSSIDFGAQPDLELASVAGSSHHKQPSMDKSWSLAGSTQATTPTSSIRPVAKTDDLLAPASPTPLELPSLDNDRGYFSSNDIDNRKLRNRFSRSSRSGHIRQTSMAESTSKRASGLKKHNRLSSVGSVTEETSPNLSDAARAHSHFKKGRFRSSSARNTPPPSYTSATSPAVTNLENDSSSNVGSPAAEKMRMQDRAKKLMMGFRTASDSVASSDKSDIMKPTPSMDTVRSSDIVASPTTGDTTPSATPSLDIDTPEGTDVASSLTKNANRMRPKTKQQTSAYTHGLIKISPAEARSSPQCKHHGWMKKKSSGLMASWKPRLFFLQGRRLSYYYSENDTEERGVIDISGHKVLVANDDPMVTIHASVTGASKASSTPQPDKESASPTKPAAPSNLFYFKLVPPRSGMSRAVQFTKPAVHYFQVDSISEGRKWMGEIMKATIEHELSQFETTNRQKTIPLKLARARRERPPALDDTKKIDPPPAEGTQENGLGIGIAADPPGSTSPKALSLLGLGPKPSFNRADTMDKDLPAVPIDEEDKENLDTPPEPPNKSENA